MRGKPSAKRRMGLPSFLSVRSFCFQNLTLFHHGDAALNASHHAFDENQCASPRPSFRLRPNRFDRA